MHGHLGFLHRQALSSNLQAMRVWRLEGGLAQTKNEGLAIASLFPNHGPK